ncbi:MAG: hypothetical protein WCE48_05945, partial [Steroidobacteraceae bacterium]
LEAGCDVLPVCNSRPGVIALLDGLKARSEPASQLRLVRLRGRDGLPLETLVASAAWRECQQLLEQCKAPPAFGLDGGAA